MFWLFKKDVDDNFKFNMKFLNYRKSMIDDEEIFVFENTNKLLNYDYNITCLVFIKENLIKFENDKINCCFRIKEDIFNDSKIYYEYEKINNDCFPYVIESNYDFLKNVNFKIVEKENNKLLIKEEINNEYRYYEINY